MPFQHVQYAPGLLPGMGIRHTAKGDKNNLIMSLDKLQQLLTGLPAAGAAPVIEPGDKGAAGSMQRFGKKGRRQGIEGLLLLKHRFFNGGDPKPRWQQQVLTLFPLHYKILHNSSYQ